MKLSTVLSAFALLLTFSLSTYALNTKRVAVGPDANHLSVIAREAANAKMQADEIEAYLRTNGSPDWRYLASEMDYLKEHVRNLQKSVASFERSEPKLTEAQGQELERLNDGLATLTVFVNNTNRLIAEQKVLPHRNTLMSNAKAISIRADIIRDAARSIRVAESA
jgi:hypothetical protein